MKVAVFGAGALGSLLGAHLARHNEVWLVGRNPHIDAVASHGLTVSGALEGVFEMKASLEMPPHWMPDLVVVSVKAFDTQNVGPALRGRLGPRSVVLTVQNGLGNLESLTAQLERNIVLAASVVYGARMDKPGRIVASGAPQVAIGSSHDSEDIAEVVADAFVQAGLPANAVADIRGVLVAKAMVNAVINPLTAINALVNEQILGEPFRTQGMAIAAESDALTKRLEYHVPLESVWGRVEEIARNTGRNISSMRQDVDAGRRTEANEIIGALVALGREHDIAMPRHEALLAQLRRLSTVPGTST